MPSNMAAKTELVICRLQDAAQNLKYARTVNAKVILRVRKKLYLQRHANRKYLLSQEIVFWELEFASEALWIKFSQLHTFKNNNEW